MSANIEQVQHTKHQQSTQNDDDDADDDDTSDGNCVDMHDNIVIIMLYSTTVKGIPTAREQQQQ